MNVMKSRFYVNLILFIYLYFPSNLIYWEQRRPNPLDGLSLNFFYYWQKILIDTLLPTHFSLTTMHWDNLLVNVYSNNGYHSRKVKFLVVIWVDLFNNRIKMKNLLYLFYVPFLVFKDLISFLLFIINFKEVDVFVGNEWELDFQ